MVEHPAEIVQLKGGAFSIRQRKRGRKIVSTEHTKMNWICHKSLISIPSFFASTLAQKVASKIHQRLKNFLLSWPILEYCKFLLKKPLSFLLFFCTTTKLSLLLQYKRRLSQCLLSNKFLIAQWKIQDYLSIVVKFTLIAKKDNKMISVRQMTP